MSATPDHLTALESALAGLAPSTGGLSRDRLMYEAGRQAVRQRLHWPVLAAAFAGLSAWLGFQMMTRPEPHMVERVVPVAGPGHSPSREAATAPVVATHSDGNWGNALRSSAGYLSRRDQVLFFGTDVLPATPTAPEAPRKPTQDMKTLLGAI